MEQLQDKITAWLNSDIRDFFEGIGLLSQLTINRTLIRNLSKKESKYSREKLANELQKHLKRLPPISTTQQIEAKTDPDQGNDSGTSEQEEEEPPADPAGGAETIEGEEIVIPGFEPGPGIQLPPPDGSDKLPPVTVDPEHAKAVEELEISYSKMYNKKGMLINSLRAFAEPDNDGRKAVMDQVSSISTSMQSIRSKIDHFKEHGQLPVQEEQSTQVFPPQPIVIPDDPVRMKNLLLNLRSTASKLKKKIADGVELDRLPFYEAELQKKTNMINEIKRRLHGAG